MRKNVIKSILGVALATGVLGAAVFVGAKVEKAPVKEAEAAKVDEDFLRLYITRPDWGGIPLVGSSFGPANQPEASVSISADASKHKPASGTSVVASHTHVSDVSLSQAQNEIHFTFFQGSDRWVPKRGSQSTTEYGFRNGLFLNDSFNYPFNPGYIYNVSYSAYAAEYKLQNSGHSDPYDGNNTRVIKFFTYSITTNGYMIHFDLDGGTGPAGFVNDIEVTLNAAVTLPAAPTKSGYTFMGWEASTNGILNKASTSFTTSAPMTFTAIWHSNTMNAVDGDKVRVWVGYNDNNNVSSLFYNGYGVTTKLWVHQGNGSAGTEQSVIHRQNDVK